MKSISFELSSIERNGKCQILSRVNFSRDYRPRLKTGIYITPDNFKDGMIKTPKRMKECKDKTDLVHAKYLLDVFRAHALLLAKASEGKRMSKKVMEMVLHPEFANKGIFTSIERLAAALEELEPHDKNIYEYMDDYTKAKGLSSARINVYSVLKRLIMRFNLFQVMAGAQELTLEYPQKTTPENISSFVAFMENEHKLATEYPETFKRIVEKVALRIPTAHRQAFHRILPKGQNTIQDYVKIMGALYRWLHEQGHIDRDDLLSQIQQSESVYLQAFYLTIEERNMVDRMTIPRKKAQNVMKDIFIFQCLTGCRYGDLCKLSEGNIIDGVLTYRPSKTRIHANQVVPRVPLAPRALELIEKYRGQDSDGRLFPFAKHGTYVYNIKQILKKAGIDRLVCVYDRKTGDYKSVPLYEAAASHMARKTFVGTAYKMVKDPNIIGTMSGHAYGSVCFSRYRQIDDEDRWEVINGIE